jgi:hypothetical protein
VKFSDCLKTQSFNGSESMYGASKLFCFLLFFLLCLIMSIIVSFI